MLLGGGAWWFSRGPACTPDDFTGTMLGYIRAYREPCAVFEWDPRDPGYPNHIIRYNNFGMHDQVTSFENPNDLYRILIIGDSYPQGLQVPLEQGFPAILEDWLNDSGVCCEVINLSIDTIGTDRMLMLYALVGHRFEADLVLLVTYVGNDIQNNSIELAALRNEGYQPRPFFKLDEVGNLRLHNWQGEFPMTDSQAESWLRRATVSSPYDIVPPDTPAILSEDPYILEYPVQLGLYLPEDDNWREAWAISEAILGQFADLVEAEGSDFGVVVIPDRRTVHAADYNETIAQYPFLGAFDADISVDRTLTAVPVGVPVYDARQALGPIEIAGGRAYLPLDGHLSPEGHQALASALDRWINATFDQN
ncbi:MAG: hypothetical protein AAF125_09390 [Chloroflexota bacterium]